MPKVRREDGAPLSPLGQLALAHAANGWPVFPCAPRRKVPLTEHGFKDATRDPEQIRAWWTKYPDANIGGYPSTERVVVDFDPKYGGLDTLTELELEHGSLEGALVLTGQHEQGRGRHYHYRQPDPPIRDCKPLRGVDVKAKGGYVLLSGSIHPSGVEYEGGIPPLEQLPVAPEWLTKRDKTTTSTALEGERTDFDRYLREGVPAGEHDDRTFKYACHLRSLSTSWDIARGRMRIWYGKLQRHEGCVHDLEWCNQMLERVWREYPEGRSSEASPAIPPKRERPTVDLGDLTGEQILDEVERFLGRFIAYPSEHALVAHVLWIAHTWQMDCWDSTPRIAFLSPEPGSGKSRCLEVTSPLVPRPVHAVNVTPAYLFRKVSDPAGTPTILYDEIDTVFGPRASGDHEDIRGMLNAGHRKGAIAGRCVVRGKVIETEELPAYCAVALAGLDDLPDTIMTRSVVVRMRRRSPDEYIQPWRPRINEPQAFEIAVRLEAWIESVTESKLRNTFPVLPVQDRDADVWEALITVADAAGEGWGKRAREAAVYLVQATAESRSVSLGVQLLRDVRAIFEAQRVDRMPSVELLEQLHDLEEAPWADLRGKGLDARGLANFLGKYGVQPRNARMKGGKQARGYLAEDLYDAWVRYLPDVTDVTKTPIGVTAELFSTRDVTSVTSVTSVEGDSEGGAVTSV